MTGGPSTGKSLVLKRLLANDSKYLYLDGRMTGPNIISAIVDNINERENQSSLNNEVIKNIIMPLMIFSLTTFFGNDFSEKLKLSDILIKIVEVVTKNPMMAPKSLKLLLKLV